MTENNFENMNMETEEIKAEETMEKAEIIEADEKKEEAIEVNERAEEKPVAEFTPEKEEVKVGPTPSNAQANQAFDYRFGYPDQINKVKKHAKKEYAPQPEFIYNEVNNQSGYIGQQTPPQYTEPMSSQPQPQYAQPQSQPQPMPPYFNPDMGTPYAQPQQSFYYPVNIPYHQKNRLVAGLFGVIMGGIGLHNFYLGYTGRAIAQLLVTVFTLGVGSIWGFIEGLMIISDCYKDNLDSNGIPTREI